VSLALTSGALVGLALWLVRRAWAVRRSTKLPDDERDHPEEELTEEMPTLPHDTAGLAAALGNLSPDDDSRGDRSDTSEAPTFSSRDALLK
jgi:hypothetical protein